MYVYAWVCRRLFGWRFAEFDFGSRRIIRRIHAYGKPWAYGWVYGRPEYIHSRNGRELP